MSIFVPKKIILHCSATKDTDSLSWKAIQEYHIRTLGWDDIGYHYGLELVDGSYVILQGRHPNTKGAHCKAAGRNSDSLGVCVVGNYDEVSPHPERFNRTAQFLSQLCFIFDIDPTDIYGHSYFEPMKTCPGKKWNMDLLKSDVDYYLTMNYYGRLIT